MAMHAAPAARNFLLANAVMGPFTRNHVNLPEGWFFFFLNATSQLCLNSNDNNSFVLELAFCWMCFRPADNSGTSASGDPGHRVGKLQCVEMHRQKAIRRASHQSSEPFPLHTPARQHHCWHTGVQVSCADNSSVSSFFF